MTDIILIVGLPGSGKTFLANQMSTIDAVIVDDIVSVDQLPDSDKIIITDVNFCDSTILKKAKEQLMIKYGLNTIIDVIYFENDSDAARQNVNYRNDGRNVEGTIRKFEGVYKPPANARTIWKR